MKPVDVKEVKARAAGRWPGIVRALAPSLCEAVDRIGKHVKCPIHQGQTSTNFRLYPDFAETGGGYCNTCGGFADGFALLMWVTGNTFKEVLDAVAAQVGGAAGPSSLGMAAPVVKSHTPPPKDNEAIRKRLRWVYQTSFPLTAPEAEPARRYLRSRGLKLLPAMLRMHPGLHWRPKEGKLQGPFPVLIACIVNKAEHGVTIHRTYLTPEGRKAPVEEAKKVMALPSDRSLHGSAIRLFPWSPVLGVSEGIETAIAVTQATGIPCWPLVSAQFMPSFEPPDGTKRVIVFADKNIASRQHPSGHGQEAGQALVARLLGTGIQAELALPPSPIPDGAKDVDWHDEFCRSGGAAFRSVLAAA